MSWNAACADCHATGFHKGFDVVANRYDSTWAEIGVGCEACSRRGLARPRLGARGRVAIFPSRTRCIDGAGAAGGRDAAAEPRSRWGARRVIRCARGSPSSQRARQSVSQRYEPALLDRALYHDDGQVAEQTYEWGSFVQTRKYAAGVRCSDCHEPHSGRLAPRATRCAEAVMSRRNSTRPRITIMPRHPHPPV